MAVCDWTGSFCWIGHSSKTWFLELERILGGLSPVKCDFSCQLDVQNFDPIITKNRGLIINDVVNFPESIEIGKVNPPLSVYQGG